MASLSAYFSYDANTIDRGIPYAQFTAFQYNTGGSIWYNRSVRPTGTLFVAGRNNVGQLGLGNNVDTNTFIQLTGQWEDVACGSTCMFAKSAGTNRWFGTGYNRSLGAGFDAINYNTLTPLTGEWRIIVPSGKNATFTMAISAGTNTLFGTGANNYGQLGLGNTTTRYTFTALTGNWSNVFVGGNHTMALSAGTTKLFGTGQCDPYGQLGLGTIYGDYKTFTQVAGDWSDVACGTDFTAALSAGTNFWYGCGDASDSPLGMIFSSSTFRALTIHGIGAPKFSKMFCGAYNSFGLSAGTTKLYGSGYNGYGTLGTGNNKTQDAFIQIPGNWLDVYCGTVMTLALSTKNNKLFVTGSNTYGQFGIGNNSYSYSFIDTNSYITKAGGGNNFTAILQANNFTSPLVVDNFENQPITFKMRPITNSGVTGSEASFFHNPPPVLFGTGDNFYGTLGLGNSGAGTDRNTFTALTGNWSQMALGQYHTMAIGY